MGAGGGEWAAVRAELLRPGLSGGGAGSRVCLGGEAGTGAGGTAGGWALIAVFVTDSAFASLTGLAAGVLGAGLADLAAAGAAAFVFLFVLLAATAPVFFFGSGAVLAAAGDGLAAATGFLAGAETLFGVFAGTAFAGFAAALTALAAGLRVAVFEAGFVFTAGLAAGLEGVLDVLATAVISGLLRETTPVSHADRFLAFASGLALLLALSLTLLVLVAVWFSSGRSCRLPGLFFSKPPGWPRWRAIVAVDPERVTTLFQTVGESRQTYAFSALFYKVQTAYLKPGTAPGPAGKYLSADRCR